MSYIHPLSARIIDRINSFPRTAMDVTLKKGMDLVIDTLEPLILDQARWYLNEDYLHEDFEYAISILIQRRPDISVFGTRLVNLLPPQ